jgi:hypothetical protein
MYQGRSDTSVPYPRSRKQACTKADLIPPYPRMSGHASYHQGRSETSILCPRSSRYVSASLTPPSYPGSMYQGRSDTSVPSKDEHASKQVHLHALPKEQTCIKGKGRWDGFHFANDPLFSDENVLALAASEVQIQYHYSTDFKPKSVIVITWENVAPADAPNDLPNSVRVMIQCNPKL